MQLVQSLERKAEAVQRHHQPDTEFVFQVQTPALKREGNARIV